MDQIAKSWFMAILEGLVKNPEVANFARRTGRFDLEIIIRVADEDRARFTPGVCLALTALLAAKTDVPQPVVYLEGAPHPAAAEAINYADNQV